MKSNRPLAEAHLSGVPKFLCICIICIFGPSGWLYRQYTFGLGHGRTNLCSGLCGVEPRCLCRVNAGRTMTVLHHALCGHDFDQTPVSKISRGKCSEYFLFCFVCDVTQASMIGWQAHGVRWVTCGFHAACLGTAREYLGAA